MREYQVLLTRGGILCDGEVVGLEAQSFNALGIAGRQAHQTPLPPSGKDRGGQINRIRVVTKVLVKR